MPKHLATLLCLAAFFAAGRPSPSQAETRFASEEHFQDLFITAGYSTAFGAALGAAFLGLTPEPMENLRFVAFGASLGFIGGSLFGTYVMIAPALSLDRVEQAPSAPTPSHAGLAANPAFGPSSQPAYADTSNQRQLTLRPQWNLGTQRLSGFRADFVVSRF